MPTTADQARPLEEQIDQWRSYLRRRQAIHSVDVAELEDHLREQVAVLLGAVLVYFCFPRKEAEEQLLRDYAAQDS